MSRISNLLAQILSAVYGKDVRQAIHDSIEQCYSDVSTAKTLADDSVTAANAAAANAETRVTTALTNAESRVNTAVGNANSATTAANTAAANANAKAGVADTAATEVRRAFADLKLSIVDGKLCMEVTRE